MDELMQIPDSGELEWLESCCLLSDYEEEEEFLVNEEDTEIQERCLQAPVCESPHPRDTKASGKRIWSEKESKQACREVLCEGGQTKRRALDKEEDEKHDENWLRYSQSLPKVVDVHEVFENDHPMTEAPMVEKILSRFAIDIEGECIPITGPSGDRVYAKLQREEMADRGLNNLGMDKTKDGLISEPISAIITKLDHEAFAKAFEEEGELPSHPTITEQLWVEKYAPSSFSELLSDDQTNREVLLWLKQWDSCVFGSQIKATTDDVLSALRSHSSNFQNQKFSERNSLFSKARSGHFGSKKLKPLNLLDRQGKNFNGASESWNKKTMVDHPLGQKVLLLCGPPGLGKTTLAHVAAKHCGYRVVEINASDDRSSAAIESKILDAVQMNSVVADSKPKCLVIDEIDGSLGEGKGAVEVILKMVAADKKNSTEKADPTEQASSGNSSKKGPKSATLLRPVICICNDLYTPALRPIRQIAKVHIFMQPSVSRVVNRLKHICKKEGYRTNSIALATLAEYTECDIRSCLNTLQFLNKKKETLNILEVGSQVVGRKDISRSYFDIWKVIFHKRKDKREKRPKNDASDRGDFDFMYSVLSNRGDHDLALDGIHENFLGVSYHDPLMLKTVKCLDMVGVADRLHQYIMRNQQMALHAYQPLLAIIISRLIARVEKPNIEWPKSLQRCRNLFMEKMELFKLWQSRISPNMSRHLSTEYFSEDFVSHFLHILAPLTLRPVSLHLFSEREKDDLAQLVDTMVTYSLTYKNSRDENLQVPDKPGSTFDVPVLSLEPPIDEFINFKDYKPGYLGLSLVMKQILLHEVEKEKILRESSGRSLSLRNQNVNHSQASNVSNSELLLKVDTSNSVYDRGSGKPTVTNLKKQMGGDKISSSKLKGISNTIKATGNSMKPRPSTDFFKRFRVGSNIDLKNVADNLQKKATAERDARPFLFKYNEGFTNAVKRPVKVRELL